MKIDEVYQRFSIPPNLREHMFRVFGVVSFICESWKGEAIDKYLVKKLALLHDLGNIVKFDFDKHPEFLGDEQKNVDHWKQVRKEIIAKYGEDDHDVTEKMLQELGLDVEAIEIALSKSFGNSVATKNSNNWLLKILYYADLRTLPFGVGTLEERIKDVRNRMPKYTSRPDFEDLVSACKEIEKQLQLNLSIQVSDINDKAIKVFEMEASNFEI